MVYNTVHMIHVMFAFKQTEHQKRTKKGKKSRKGKKQKQTYTKKNTNNPFRLTLKQLFFHIYTCICNASRSSV